MRHARWSLRSDEQRALDRIALELDADRSITGRKLRHALGVSPEAFEKMKAALVPRYVVEGVGHKGDYYGLSLPGMLRSSESSRVVRVIDSTLLVLREKFDADPDVAGFTTDDVLHRGGFDASDGCFIDAVLHAAWLTLGGGGQGQGQTLRMNYGVPQDIEEVVRCATFADFIRLVQTSAPHARSPS